MKFGLIVTGGTLDSVQTPAGLGCESPGGVDIFTAGLIDSQDSLTTLSAPWRQDSSQLSFGQILALAETLERAESMDAILVGVGTDTLSYLAPTLWALSARFPTPILLVSGMQPWWMSGSDGAINMRDAIGFARKSPMGVEVITAGKRLSPLNLHKFSHICPDPFRNVIHLTPGTLDQVLMQIPGGIAPLAPPPPKLPISPICNNPVVPWLVMHPALTAIAIKTLLGADSKHVVISGYSGGTLPHWAMDAIQPGTCIHVISQQWGDMCPNQYEASSSLLRRNIHFWNLTGESLTALLAVAISFEMSAGTAIDWLRGIEKSIL
jgi:L-asparaginase/Glu-tRNA(Gln) amidotransferase subunit D